MMLTKQRDVIARLDVQTGRSSTPRPIGSYTDASGILDAPVEPGMTAEAR
jgi:hypothetical protein